MIGPHQLESFGYLLSWKVGFWSWIALIFWFSYSFMCGQVFQMLRNVLSVCESYLRYFSMRLKFAVLSSDKFNASHCHWDLQWKFHLQISSWNLSSTVPTLVRMLHFEAVNLSSVYKILFLIVYYSIFCLRLILFS